MQKVTHGLTYETDLKTTPGLGNSLTYFASTALFEWNEWIPKPGAASRQERRKKIIALAGSWYLDPLILLAVVCIMKRRERKKGDFVLKT